MEAELEVGFQLLVERWVGCGSLTQPRVQRNLKPP